MKAWVGWDAIYDDVCEFVFADTEGQAKAKVQAEIGDGIARYDFTNYRVRRCPWLDGEPRRPTKAELITHRFTEYAEGMPDAQ